MLVNFKLRGDETAAEDAVAPVLAAVERVQAAHQDVFVGEFGGASANKALSKAFADDFKKAEKLSLPITLIILVLAFGALVAAGVPLLLGLSAVMAALGLVALPVASSCRSTTTPPRSSCSSASRSASTTRSSTCAANARNARAAPRTATRSTPPPPPPAARC